MHMIGVNEFLGEMGREMGIIILRLAGFYLSIGWQSLLAFDLSLETHKHLGPVGNAAY